MKLVYGFGVNDADYAVKPRINGRQIECPSYTAWAAMLRRCYSDHWLKRHPTYVGVTVCDEWKSFMSFRSWWVDNHVDGWSLDKDLLSDSKIYSPDTCVYVPQWLNTLTTNCAAARGEFPIGVSFSNIDGKYTARCRHPFRSTICLGSFNCKDDAYMAWLKCKLLIAGELRGKMDEIDERIYPRVIDMIMSAK